MHINSLLKKEYVFIFVLKGVFPTLQKVLFFYQCWTMVIFTCMHLCLFKKKTGCSLSFCPALCNRCKRKHTSLSFIWNGPVDIIILETHILIFTAKALMGKLPNYISSLLSQRTSTYSTRSSEKMLLTVLTSRTEIGKTAFQIYAPFVWNELQSILNLHSLPSLDIFLNDLKTSLTEQCHCI